MTPFTLFMLTVGSSRARVGAMLQAGDRWREPLAVLTAGSGCVGHMRGDYEGINMTPTSAVVVGWAVDPNLGGGGMPPVPVQVTIGECAIAAPTCSA